MKISVLLPYKENFSPDYPGAVSLFVSETTKISKYKKLITVFGNTNYKNRFGLKYINIELKRELFSSQTKIAANQIRQFHNALDQWKLNNYKYPDSLESLTEADPITGDPLLKRIPLDPWQNEYQYEFDQDNNPIITSFGADGSPGGEAKDADISTETIDQQ